MSSVVHPDYHSYRVKRLFQLISQRIEDVLKPHGLGRTQWQVLFRVHRAGTLPQKDLVQALQVEPATLTGVIDALSAKGWLQRLDSDSDKRCRVLRLSPAGEELLARIPDPYESVERHMLAGVTPQERELVERTLEHMITNLEDRS